MTEMAELGIMFRDDDFVYYSKFEVQGDHNTPSWPPEVLADLVVPNEEDQNVPDLLDNEVLIVTKEAGLQGKTEEGYELYNQLSSFTITDHKSYDYIEDSKELESNRASFHSMLMITLEQVRTGAH